MKVYETKTDCLDGMIKKPHQERFKLLEYSYIGGRYDPKYKISKEDLEILAETWSSF